MLKAAIGLGIIGLVAGGSVGYGFGWLIGYHKGAEDG
jgi:hypothetical protein